MLIKPYIHSPEEHSGFVLSSFCLQTGEPDSKLRDLIQGGARIFVAEAPTAKRSDGSKVLYGWAGTFEGTLIYAYVVHKLRTFPVIPRLLEALDVDYGQPDKEIPVMFLTRQMKAIGRHWECRFVPMKGEN